MSNKTSQCIMGCGAWISDQSIWVSLHAWEDTKRFLSLREAKTVNIKVKWVLISNQTWGLFFWLWKKSTTFSLFFLVSLSWLKLCLGIIFRYTLIFTVLEETQKRQWGNWGYLANAGSYPNGLPIHPHDARHIFAQDHLTNKSKKRAVDSQKVCEKQVVFIIGLVCFYIFINAIIETFAFFVLVALLISDVTNRLSKADYDTSKCSGEEGEALCGSPMAFWKLLGSHIE